MWDDSAEDSRQITGGKGHSQLGSLRIFVLGLLVEDSFVELLDDLLEGHEFYDGVGDLTAPERWETFVESADAFEKGEWLFKLNNNYSYILLIYGESGWDFYGRIGDEVGIYGLLSWNIKKSSIKPSSALNLLKATKKLVG